MRTLITGLIVFSWFFVVYYPDGSATHSPNFKAEARCESVRAVFVGGSLPIGTQVTDCLSTEPIGPNIFN